MAPAEGWGDKGLGRAQSQGLRSLGRYPKEQKLNEMGYREKRSLRAQMDARVKQALGLAGNGGSHSIPGTVSDSLLCLGLILTLVHSGW